MSLARQRKLDGLRDALKRLERLAALTTEPHNAERLAREHQKAEDDVRRFMLHKRRNNGKGKR